MTIFYNIETEEYPLHLGDLWLLGIDENNLPEHIVPVVGNVPEFNRDIECLYEEKPSKDKKNVWNANIKVRPLTSEEIQANAMAEIERLEMLNSLE